MRWGILGSLSVEDDAGSDVAVPVGRLRVLLAALLTRANRPVPVDELAEFVWDGEPTPKAARTVRVYVTRLRQALNQEAAGRLVTQTGGYMLQVGEDELDLLRFEELCRQGRRAVAEKAWARAVRVLDEALALWRGTPLADVPSGLLREREAPRLEELRLQAAEDRVDALIRLGRHESIVPRLRELVEKNPYREHLRAQLMRALVQAGRRAEALEAYRDSRRVLAEELGIEPGRELSEVHERILLEGTGSAPRTPAPARRRQPPEELRSAVTEALDTLPRGRVETVEVAPSGDERTWLITIAYVEDPSLAR
jgi:DNA-binding SARP family transcriptional activator